MIIFDIQGKEITNENIRDILLGTFESAYDKWLQNQVARHTLVLIGNLKRIVNKNGCSTRNRLQYLKQNVVKYYDEIEETLHIGRDVVDFMIEFAETNTKII